MTKLKKLFPLSFVFTKNPLVLFLGILIYLVANALVIGILNFLPSLLLLPLAFFAIPWLGWILLLILCIPVLLYIGFVLLLSIVLSYVGALVNIYTYAGIAVCFVAYAKDDEPAAEAEIVEAE